MELDFEKENGLIPAIVQDHVSGEVLMLGFMNREAFDLTQKTGFVTFYSRSRKKLWLKGETSGKNCCCASCASIAIATRCWSAPNSKAAPSATKATAAAFFARSAATAKQKSLPSA